MFPWNECRDRCGNKCIDSHFKLCSFAQCSRVPTKVCACVLTSLKSCHSCQFLDQPGCEFQQTTKGSLVPASCALKHLQLTALNVSQYRMRHNYSWEHNLSCARSACISDVLASLVAHDTIWPVQQSVADFRKTATQCQEGWQLYQEIRSILNMTVLQLHSLAQPSQQCIL